MPEGAIDERPAANRQAIMPKLNKLSAAGLLAKLQARDVTALQLASHCIERIEQRDDEVGAWTWTAASGDGGGGSRSVSFLGSSYDLTYDADIDGAKIGRAHV